VLLDARKRGTVFCVLRLIIRFCMYLHASLWLGLFLVLDLDHSRKALRSPTQMLHSRRVPSSQKRRQRSSSSTENAVHVGFLSLATGYVLGCAALSSLSTRTTRLHRSSRPRASTSPSSVAATR